MNTPTQPTDWNEPPEGEQPPDLSGDGYTGLKEIARTNFSRVYYARSNDSLARDVAIKELLNLSHPADPDEYAKYLQRFRQEAQLSGGFTENQHIVTIFHVIRDQYLVMHYFKGGTLRHWLNEVGTLPLADALRVAISLCLALEDIWKHRILHRDIKPENIYLVFQDDDSIKYAALGDFGVAFTSKHATQLTEYISHPGTSAYMSPEQENNKQFLDVRSDLYAVGAVLYEMVFGEQYKYSEHSLRGAVPDEAYGYIGSILNKLLQKNIEARYASPAALRADLEKVLAGERPGTAPIPIITKQAPTPSRWRRVVGAVLLLLILILGLTFWYDDLVSALRGEAGLPTATPTVTIENTATTTPDPGTPIPPNTEVTAGDSIQTVTATPEPPTQTPTLTLTPTMTPTVNTPTPTPTLTLSPTPIGAFAFMPAVFNPPPTPTPVPIPSIRSLPFSFESFSNWAQGDQRNGTLSPSGSGTGKFEYRFNSNGNEFAVVLQAFSIPSTANGLRISVNGNGSGDFLNALIKDADGERWQIPLGEITFSGWQEMTGCFVPSNPEWPYQLWDGRVNGRVDYPVTFAGLVIDDHPDTDKSTEHIFVDDLRGATLPNCG